MDAVNKAKRTVVRTQTTKLINKIESKFHQGDSDEEELEQFLAELSLKENELNYLDTEIQKQIKLDELESEVLKCDEYNSSLVIWKSKIKRAKLKLETRSNINVSTTTSNNSEERVVVRGFESPHINLPRLIIDKFDGDPSDWQRFWDQFESAIHKNTEISNVDKFNYLRSYLKGVASDAIKGFNLTNNNYQSAIDSLKDRFGKKTIVINSHLNKLLNLNHVRKSSDVVSLRKLFDSCQTEIRNLEALGVKEDNYGALLCPILIRLLPSDIVLEISKKYGNDDEWKVSEIIEILKSEVVSREKAASLISSSSTQHTENFTSPHSKRDRFELTNKFNRNPPSTASGLLNETNVKRNKCFYCESEKHLLPNCNDFKIKQIKEKRDFLMNRGCCFVCFLKGHLANKCRSSIKCRKCGRRHYEIMCPENQTDNIIENESTVLSNKTCNQEVLMQTLTVCLRNRNKEILIRALIDSGSQKSYLTKEVINKLGFIPKGVEKLNHSLFGGLQQTQKHNQYRIFLSDISKRYSCNFDVYDQEKICAQIPSIRDGPWIKEAKKQGICFSDYENVNGSKLVKENDIHLLIGADICGKLLTGEIRSLSKDLVAIETRLGWTIMGKTNKFTSSDSTNVVLSLHVAETQISDLWRLDTLGILDPGQKGTREEMELAAEEHFNRNIRIVEDGRYEVSLPWIDGHAPLPSYRNVADRRVESCVESLKKAGRLEAYEAVFKEWLQEGIIEEVSEDNTQNEHYLPHRAVIKENSTTKIRPVFDGSAKIKGLPSINDCLEKGPNLVELIPSIINRFRLKRIGVVSDIRKAFLQIQLSQSDRPFLKFIWWENGDPKNIRVFQHQRVVFGLTCSPYLLGATLQYHLKNVPEAFKETAEKLLESFYVDNCVTSVEDEKELKKFIDESKFLLNLAKFDLRGWEHNILSTQTNSDPYKKRNIPVLGLNWNLRDDSLSIDLREDEEENQILTKRKILSLVHRVFDPIGYTCPVTLRPKIMLQECWKLKVTWDGKLPTTIEKKFEKWKNQLIDLKGVAIPRCIANFPEASQSLSLHVFCDASKVAYATCIFLRNVTRDSISCQLVQARSRVSPLKTITIPRMELLACTIGARLAKSVKTDLRMPELPTFFWSDSGNALFWIKKNDNWAPFVYNRVQEIRSLSNPEDWNYVPGSLNPADLPSRGCSADYLKKSLWWEGPQWLKNAPELWPKDVANPDFEVVNAEKRKTVVAATNVQTRPINFYENSTSYRKMVTVTAWIRRFFRNVQNKSNNRNLENKLSVDEIKEAELTLLKYVQTLCLSNESKSYSSLEKITDDQGIIRVRTRIALRDDLDTFKYPIVLPCDHNVTLCLIFDKHRELNHAGTQTVMSVLREQFWIIRCRKTVQKIIKKCVRCKRFKARPVEVPSAPLPRDRVREALVFEVIGTDLCGPLFLRDGSKCWIVLFTCAVFRAIHVELVTSLSAESFLLAFRRFIARRGRPTTVFSDNGRNFTRSSAELNSVDIEKVKEFATSKKIQWKFNPPSAPWWGGFFERMVGLLKAVLRRVLGRANLHYEELYTVLCDAESVINSRPLTYISEDQEDLVPLTPAMFLQEIKDSGVPDIDLIDATRMKKRFAYRQKVREDLRKRFRIEYLGQLREFARKTKETQLKEGDIVLIGDDISKRINWPLGRIEAIYPGKDGRTRVVRVKTQRGSYLRPVRRIYPLEVRDNTY